MLVLNTVIMGMGMGMVMVMVLVLALALALALVLVAVPRSRADEHAPQLSHGNVYISLSRVRLAGPSPALKLPFL